MSAHAVRRAYVEIEHGQIHCRIVGDPASDRHPPLLMLHGGPGSSLSLLPMITALAAAGRTVIAPDMMGNGQSDPPPRTPDMAFYVECAIMALDRLGAATVDCYGHHVGAQIVCELAIRAPDRVRRLVLDGLGLFSDDQRREFVARYAPPIEPDSAGAHLAQLWAFLSAMTMRFPHYSKDDRDRIAGGAPLPPAILTDLFADIVRNWRSYHLSYGASFGEDLAARLPLVRQSVLIFQVAGDPLSQYAAAAAKLIDNARVLQIERAARADAILETVRAEAG